MGLWRGALQQIALRSDRCAPAATRGFVTQVLSDGVAIDVVDTAKLLVTELVSIQHAASDDLIVEVDREPAMPQLTVNDHDERRQRPLRPTMTATRAKRRLAARISLVRTLSRPIGDDPIAGGKKGLARTSHRNVLRGLRRCRADDCRWQCGRGCGSCQESSGAVVARTEPAGAE